MGKSGDTSEENTIVVVQWKGKPVKAKIMCSFDDKSYYRVTLIEPKKLCGMITHFTRDEILEFIK